MAPKQMTLNLVLLLLGISQAVSIPSAADSEEKAGKKTVSLHAIFNKHKDRTLTEQIRAERLYLYNKYGVAPHLEELIGSTGPGTSNPVTPLGNSAYNIQLNIGGQIVNLIPDTGSNILWVPSPSIASGKPAPESWNPSLSTTSFSVPNTSWSINYYSPQFDVSGQVWGDNIYWNSAGSAAEYHNAPIFYATKSGSNETGGILGLDHNVHAPYTQNGISKNDPTFFQGLIPTLPAPVFTVDFKNLANGTIDFGIINSTKYTGSITYLPTTAGSEFWNTSTTGFTIVGKYTNNGYPINWLVDTGSSLMYLPQDVVKLYWSYVTGSFYGSNGYNFPCTSTLPDLKLNIGSAFATTPGSYLVFGSYGNGSCLGSLQNNFLSPTQSLFGDAWIKSQFLVFKNGTSSAPTTYIGVANKTLTS